MRKSQIHHYQHGESSFVTTNNPTSWITMPTDRRIIHNDNHHHHHYRLSLKNLLSDDVQSNQTESTQGSPDVFCTPAYLHQAHNSRRSNDNKSSPSVPPSSTTASSSSSTSTTTTTTTTLALTAIARACYRRSHPAPHPLRVRSSLSMARETVTSRAAASTFTRSSPSQHVLQNSRSTSSSSSSSSSTSTVASNNNNSREANVGQVSSRGAGAGVTSVEVGETSLSGAAAPAAAAPPLRQQRSCPRSHSVPVKCPAPRRRWSSRSLPENDDDYHDHDPQPAHRVTVTQPEPDNEPVLHPNDLENLQRLYDRRTWDMYFRITEARARQRESHKEEEERAVSETTMIPHTAGRNKAVPIDNNDDDDDKDVSIHQDYRSLDHWNPENDPATDTHDDDWKFNHQDDSDSDDPAASIYCSVSYDSQGQHYYHHQHELIFGDLED